MVQCEGCELWPHCCCADITSEHAGNLFAKTANNYVAQYYACLLVCSTLILPYCTQLNLPFSDILSFNWMLYYIYLFQILSESCYSICSLQLQAFVQFAKLHLDVYQYNTGWLISWGDLQFTGKVGIRDPQFPGRSKAWVPILLENRSPGIPKRRDAHFHMTTGLCCSAAVLAGLPVQSTHLEDKVTHQLLLDKFGESWRKFTSRAVGSWTGLYKGLVVIKEFLNCTAS